MFGYVLPLLCRLGEEEQKRYKAPYCGLCNSLKARYGIRGRFLVNYDMTFLYFLLEEQKEEGLVKCNCLTGPFCKRPCMPNGDTMAYVADLTVLLSWWKLQDGVADGGPLKKTLSRMGLALYGDPYRRASTLRSEENRIFRNQLELLRKLEGEKCPSMDRVADTFATMLRGCTPKDRSPSEQRILQTLLYHVGRYLYLVDALEDLPKDQKNGDYNPLLYRFAPIDGKLSDEDRDSLINSVEASIDLAASALELLPVGPNREILHNIIYDGLSAVLKSVSRGEFRKKRRLKKEIDQ